jgi:hypothetical protein
MPCEVCGLSYPAGLSSCPGCGTAARRGPDLVFLPLRGLANVLTVLLAVVVSAIVVRLAIELFHLGTSHWQQGFIGLRLDKAPDLTIFVLGIVFTVWFRRARINAERRGWQQRRARAWAFWGLGRPGRQPVVPVPDHGRHLACRPVAAQRHKTARLPALWWTTWLLAGFGQRHPWPHLSADTSTVSLCLLAASAVTLIAIIRIVSWGAVGSPHSRHPATMPVAQQG